MIYNVIKKMLGLIKKDENLIIFESHSDLTDSSKALYDYLLKNYPNFKYIWVVDHKENYTNTKTTTYINYDEINKQNIKNILKIVKAKYIFYTHREVPYQNSKKQIIINLTHGVGIKEARGMMPTDCTYILSGSDNFADKTCHVYEVKESQLLPLGLPRNDLMFEESESVNNLISGYSKLILWLPTFKKHKNGFTDSNIEGDTFPLFKDDELIKLNNKLKEYNYLLILKLHPAQFIDESKKHDFNFSNIRMYKNENLDELKINFYKLIGKASAMITDYSSVGNDYMLLNRPLGYVIEDIDNFKNGRGFLFENVEDYLPGKKILNKDDFYDFIEDIKNENDEYAEQREKVRDYFWRYTDNKNIERLLKTLNIIKE